MHVLYSGPVASTLPSSRLFFSRRPLFLFFLAVHSCTHKQISSDALTADYSLFIKKISYNKLWYNVSHIAISCEPIVQINVGLAHNNG